jgi:hypothetical protein
MQVVSCREGVEGQIRGWTGGPTTPVHPRPLTSGIRMATPPPVLSASACAAVGGRSNSYGDNDVENL